MKTLIKILCAVLVLSSAAVFAGCGENNDLVASTVAVEETTDDSKKSDDSGSKSDDSGDSDDN